MIRSNLSTTEYWWSLAGDINQSNALNKWEKLCFPVSADPRTKNWFFVETPYPILAILSVYYGIVFVGYSKMRKWVCANYRAFSV